MRRTIHFASVLLALSTLAAYVGCGSHDSGSQHANEGHHDHEGDHAGHDHAGHDHEHAHGDHGPHDGRLVELGRDHKYHAELVTETDGKTIRLYVLDHDMHPCSVDASNVTLNLNAGGNPYSYTFVAVTPGATAPEFVTVSDELWKFLEEETYSVARLNVFVGGVTRVGTVAHHDHAHAGDAKRR